MQPPRIGRGKKLVFYALLIAMVYFCTELLAFFGYMIWRGSSFSWEATEARRGVISISSEGSLEDHDGGNLVSPAVDPHVLEEVIHPYLGYVLDPTARSGISNHGFPTEESFTPAAAENSQKIVIGIFGGSFAMGTSKLARSVLLEQLQRIPRFRDKDYVVHTLALPGYKQPQQLIALSYFLSLGAHFDIVINLDGFNEVALPASENMANQVFPFFPRDWFGRVHTLRRPELLAMIGQSALLQKRRKSWSRIGSRVPFRYHILSNVLWEYYDDRLARQRSDVQLALDQYEVKSKDQLNYLVTGPSFDYQDEAALYRDLANVWQRSSIQMHNLCAANDVEYFHFLQPNQYLVGSKIMTQEERSVAISENQPYRRGVGPGYPRLIEAGEELRRRGISFHDLTMLFANNDETLYIDTCCHLNERGYGMIAEAIGKVLYEEVR